MKLKRTLAILLSLVVMLGYTGCGGGSTDSGDQGGAVDSEEPVVAYVADIFNNMNPYKTNAFSDAHVYNQIYETLAVVDENSEVQGCLAKDWTVSEDGLVYTVNLVDDAVFHNGEPFKASDVVFTYEYATQFANRSAFYSMVEQVVEIDEYTVEFTLNSPTPLFLVYSQEMPILNEKFVNDNDGEIGSIACGTGPYILDTYDPAVKVTVTRNDEYRKGPAAIKNGELRYVSDGSSAVISLETGDIDFMSVPPSMVDTFIDNPSYTTQKTLPLYTAVIAMNTKVAPFDNKLVRQAFSYATDKQAIIEIAYEGYGTEARLQAYTNCFGVDYSDAMDISYDPEKAKELLAEAGYPNGMNLSEEFGVKMLTIPGTFHEKVAPVFQQNLAEIGVIIELQNTQTPDEDVESGNFAIMNQGATYRADFSYNVCNYGVVGIGGNNYSQMNEPYVDEMFEKAAIETDPEIRKDIYRELIAFLIDYCPGIPLFHKQEIYVWNSNLNAKAYDNGNHPFYFYDWSWK